MPSSPPAVIAKAAVRPPPAAAAPPSAYVVLQLAGAGCAPALRSLIGAYPTLARCRDEGGRTPLHVAAAEGHAAIVDLLLSHGADAHAADALGRTPLGEARRAGRVPALRIMADRDVPNAVSAQRLHANHAPRRELLAAAAAGDLRSATIAVANFQAHVNAVNPDGRTPLHIAVDAGHTAVASYLVANGADPAMRDRWGRTAAGQGGIAADPAMRALFEGVRAAAPAAVAAAVASASASAAEGAASAPRRSDALPRIHRVGGSTPAPAPAPPPPSAPTRTEGNAADAAAAADDDSAPHIVKVELDGDSPVRNVVSPAEQRRLLDVLPNGRHGHTHTHSFAAASAALLGNTRPHTPPVLGDRAVNELNMPHGAGAAGHPHSMPPSPFDKPLSSSRTSGFRRAQSHKTLMQSAENTRGYEWGDDWVGGDHTLPRDSQIASLPLVEQSAAGTN